jgi:hypothetical protein
MLYNLPRNNYKLSLKHSYHKSPWEAGKQLNITFYWIFIFWYMTLRHQVSTFRKIVQLSSSESDSTSVPFVTKLDPVKRHSSPPKYQELLTRHSVTYGKIGSFTHTAMLTSNLASHLALTSFYCVRINMIIQIISIWYCFNIKPYVHTVLFIYVHFFCYTTFIILGF